MKNSMSWPTAIWRKLIDCQEFSELYPCGAWLAKSFLRIFAWCIDDSVVATVVMSVLNSVVDSDVGNIVVVCLFVVEGDSELIGDVVVVDFIVGA